MRQIGNLFDKIDEEDYYKPVKLMEPLTIITWNMKAEEIKTGIYR